MNDTYIRIGNSNLYYREEGDVIGLYQKENGDYFFIRSYPSGTSFEAKGNIIRVKGQTNAGQNGY